MKYTRKQLWIYVIFHKAWELITYPQRHFRCTLLNCIKSRGSVLSVLWNSKYTSTKEIEICHHEQYKSFSSINLVVVLPVIWHTLVELICDGFGFLFRNVWFWVLKYLFIIHNLILNFLKKWCLLIEALVQHNRMCNIHMKNWYFCI